MKRNACVMLLVLAAAAPGICRGDMLGNPGFQVGKKNLFVGAEYSKITHIYDLDTGDLETRSERVNLKVTTGLADWFDIYLKVGGSDLWLNYKENNYLGNNLGYASRNFDSEMQVGFGGGTRIRLLNFVDARTRVFVQGGGYYFTASDDIVWQSGASSFAKERDLRWLDMSAGMGIVKQLDIIDVSAGVGLQQIMWWMSDVDVVTSGSAQTRIVRPDRDSFEMKNPVFGFIGIDVILPQAYRLSAQAGISSMDDYEVSVAISQGLGRE